MSKKDLPEEYSHVIIRCLLLFPSVEHPRDLFIQFLKKTPDL